MKLDTTLVAFICLLGFSATGICGLAAENTKNDNKENPSQLDLIRKKKKEAKADANWAKKLQGRQGRGAPNSEKRLNRKLVNTLETRPGALNREAEEIKKEIKEQKTKAKQAQ